MAVAASCSAFPSPSHCAHFELPLRHRNAICAEYSMLTKALISSRSSPEFFALSYQPTGLGKSSSAICFSTAERFLLDVGDGLRADRVAGLGLLPVAFLNHVEPGDHHLPELVSPVGHALEVARHGFAGQA